MPPVSADVGGFSVNTKHTATLRLQSDGSLDVEVTADGEKTVLEMLKEVVAEIGSIELPDPLPAEWTEIATVPADGAELTLSVGILVQYTEPA